MEEQNLNEPSNCRYTTLKPCTKLPILFFMTSCVVQLCTGYSKDGNLQPEGCVGYYQMEGTFKSIRKQANVEYTIGGGWVTLDRNASESRCRFPNGCSNSLDLWLYSPVAFGVQPSHLIMGCTYLGYGLMFIALSTAIKLLDKLRLYWSVARRNSQQC